MLLARGLDLIGNAEQLLHVMADLMGDDIGLRHVAWRIEPVLQLLVEIEVDIDLLVIRAVERAHLRQPHAAGRAHAAAEQHKLGIAVALAISRQEIAPYILGVGQNDRNEALEIVLACGLRMLDGRTLLPWNWEIGGVGPRLRQAGYQGRCSRRRPVSHRPCRITLGSTPKNSIRPRMMRIPRMPMPPPRLTRRSETARRRLGRGSQNRLPRHADPRHSRSLFRRATAWLSRLASRLRLPDFQALCMRRAPAQGPSWARRNSWGSEALRSAAGCAWGDAL